jgi:sulfide:quinone oxidoreductase
MSAKPRVVVLGGGFAGLETAYMLRMKLHDAVDLSVVSDRDTFLFKPNTIYIPFGAAEESLLIPLHKPLHRRHIAFHQGRVAEVDVDHKLVRVDDGSVVPYDFLVIGTGATMRPDEVPGLAEHASTIWTPAEMRSLGYSWFRRTTSARAPCTRSCSCSKPGCGGTVSAIACASGTRPTSARSSTRSGPVSTRS